MNTRKKLYNMVLLALFAGLIFLMGQTPLGLIPLGFCNVTLLVIPVAVGTLYMGWKNGLILGATFAATSLLSALPKPSALVAIASACGSLTNTVLYLGLMLLFYILCGIDNTTVLTTIAAVAGGAGPLEAIAAAIIAPPILTALQKIKK